MSEMNYANVDVAHRLPHPAVPAAREDVVHDDELLELSHDLFGAEEYGHTALSIVDAERRRVNDWRITRSVWRGNVSLSSSELSDMLYEHKRKGNQVMGYDCNFAGGFHAPAEATELRGILAGGWDGPGWPGTEYPFREPDIRSIDDDSPEAWRIVAGDVTQERLAHFLHARGLSHGLLPGAIGKAADVLNVRAGLVPQEVAAEVWAAEPGYQYVTFKEFLDAAREADVSKYAVRKMREMVSVNLNQGLHEGSVGHSALNLNAVVDGDVRVQRTDLKDYNVVKFRDIAVPSLQMIREFLRASGSLVLAQDFIGDYVADIAQSSR